VGEFYEKRSYNRQQRGYSYDRGFQDGFRVRPPVNAVLSPNLWRAFALLVHPDKWGHAPDNIKALSHECMIWLNDHKPEETEKG
jgi:hypothetical protein